MVGPTEYFVGNFPIKEKNHWKNMFISAGGWGGGHGFVAASLVDCVK